MTTKKILTIMVCMEAPNINQNKILLDAVETPLGWVSFALTQKGLIGSTFMYPSEAEALSVLRERKIKDGFSEVEEREKFHLLLEQWRACFVQLLTEPLSAGAQNVGLGVPVDQLDWTEFAKKVYGYLRTVLAGQTVTYGEIAHAVGSPGASRAVGMLMKKNPIPPLVPCHRVLGSDGKLGGFSAAGGAQLKRKMLQIETDPKGLLFPL